MIPHMRERLGASSSPREIEEVKDMVEKLDLVGLPLGEGKWTWSNSKKNPSWSRIEHFLVSNGLLMQLVGLSRTVLNRPTSDHFPICLVPEGIIWGPNFLRLDNKWLKVEGFKNLVGRVWEQTRVDGTASFILAAKLKTLKEEIKKWAREEGNLERKGSENFKEIAALDSMEMEGSLDEEGRARRESLKIETATIMNMEAISWRQKGSKKWLKEGDRNTKYFHSMTNFKRKNNCGRT